MTKKQDRHTEILTHTSETEITERPHTRGRAVPIQTQGTKRKPSGVGGKTSIGRQTRAIREGVRHG